MVENIGLLIGREIGLPTLISWGQNGYHLNSKLLFYHVGQIPKINQNAADNARSFAGLLDRVLPSQRSDGRASATRD